uniref:Uncharacterized protein n=2 Tax=Eutreptiella gymnastica TaxID=73025 RepID=A0A7S1HVE9_9EUGL|mmetsp:Transcript_108807/g.188266  ORF Transcript_108807/g.188266 Transcript_108807/m.188266 type:complete len:334 (+) Transcript_108807:106-1107(+)
MCAPHYSPQTCPSLKIPTRFVSPQPNRCGTRLQSFALTRAFEQVFAGTPPDVARPLFNASKKRRREDGDEGCGLPCDPFTSPVSPKLSIHGLTPQSKGQPCTPSHGSSPTTPARFVPSQVLAASDQQTPPPGTPPSASPTCSPAPTLAEALRIEGGTPPDAFSSVAERTPNPSHSPATFNRILRSFGTGRGDTSSSSPPAWSLPAGDTEMVRCPQGIDGEQHTGDVLRLMLDLRLKDAVIATLQRRLDREWEEREELRMFYETERLVQEEGGNELAPQIEQLVQEKMAGGAPGTPSPLVMGAPTAGGECPACGATLSGPANGTASQGSRRSAW